MAKKPGIRSPSLYEHEDGMDGLIMLLILKGLQIMVQKFQRSVIGISGDKVIKRFAVTFGSSDMEHPSLYSLTVEIYIVVYS